MGTVPIYTKAQAAPFPVNPHKTEKPFLDRYEKMPMNTFRKPSLPSGRETNWLRLAQ